MTAGSAFTFAANLIAACLLFTPVSASAAGREPVLKQVQVPHSYYWRELYLPQLTSGPSALSWSPDGAELIYSMQGSLWRQRLDAEAATQLTAGPGYDYQPDWSADGRHVVFTRYLDDALELQLLDLADGSVRPLTGNGAVNVEPRWAPDGTRLAWVSTLESGRFHIFVSDFDGTELRPRLLRPERRSNVPRYYYSPIDHELSPAWSPDGGELLFVSNPEFHHGSGGIWRAGLADGRVRPVRMEETSWKARPDWSPDGRRVLYSSYLGRQWQQLWVTTASGGDPFPLSYGEFDVTSARWSPDASRIAYIVNERGNTSIRIQQTVGGARRDLVVGGRTYRVPMAELRIDLRAGDGRAVPARLAVTDADGRAYAPDDAWMHADDGYDRSLARFETQYFHADGTATLRVPAGAVRIRAWHGLEHRVARHELELAPGTVRMLQIDFEPLDLPPSWQEWLSADLHVHMNYTGSYRNTPARLVQQARAEDLDIVQNLIVNKEQRIPDVAYFTPDPDPASTPEVLLLHAQEYHTSFWGHLGLLGLQSHLLLPDYAAYPNTAAASLYPHNAEVADLARAQQALVGYVHPFDFAPDPAAAAPLTNALPVDAALGKVDYYEVVGFSDHRVTAEVWHRLLNCGIRLAAGAGTDAMANYASLRGPVGMGRVYTRVPSADSDPSMRRSAWQQSFAAGHNLATNGPLLSLEVDGHGPGDSLAADGRPRYRGWLRSIVPVQHLELIMNGEVLRRISLKGDRTRADFDGTLPAGAGWVLLRAFSESAHPDIFDLYPYASTNPVFIQGSGNGPDCDADYFLAWIDRIEAAATEHPDYHSESERRRVLDDIARARAYYEARR